MKKDMAPNNKKEEEVVPNRSLEGAILSRIKNGEAKMKPRWHFALKTAFSLCAIIILVFSILYLASFVLFVLRQTGTIFLPSFGFRGFGLLLVSLPKLIISAVIIFVILLEILVRHYSFTYRKPLLYSVLGIVVLVFLGGYIFHKTGVHSRLFMIAEDMRMPFVRPLYRGYINGGPPEVHPGVIVSITDTLILLRDRSGREFEVMITPETRLPFGFDFEEGDEIMVFGESSTGTVRALGIRRIDFDKRPHRRLDAREPMMLFKQI